MKTARERTCNSQHSLSPLVLIFCPQPEPLKNLNELAKAQVSPNAIASAQTLSHSSFSSSCSMLLHCEVRQDLYPLGALVNALVSAGAWWNAG